MEENKDFQGDVNRSATVKIYHRMLNGFQRVKVVASFVSLMLEGALLFSLGMFLYEMIRMRSGRMSLCFILTIVFTVVVAFSLELPCSSARCIVVPSREELESGSFGEMQKEEWVRDTSNLYRIMIMASVLYLVYLGNTDHIGLKYFTPVLSAGVGWIVVSVVNWGMYNPKEEARSVGYSVGRIELFSDTLMVFSLDEDLSMFTLKFLALLEYIKIVISYIYDFNIDPMNVILTSLIMFVLAFLVECVAIGWICSRG